jgi:limonene 1,2-monooxygenase
MAKLRFGAFLAPHHPVGEHPALQLRRDLDFAVHLDRLGLDDCGAVNTTLRDGRIGSPELFLAVAGERTQRIRHRYWHGICHITIRSTLLSAWCNSIT